MSLDELFFKEMEGKARRSDHISSAATWTPKQGEFPGVTRPDINRADLWWWSMFGGLLGLDHLYMRSPWTGIAKMFTFGGFGLWWLWDWMQIWLEPKRVATYGLTAPFDLITGIGQGMIYEGDNTSYSTKTSYGFWVIAKIVFGLIGVSDIWFDNNGFWRGAFKILIFVLVFLSLTYVIQGYWLWIIGLVIGGGLMAANIYLWYSDAKIIIGDPVGFVKKGLPTPDFTYKTYQDLSNWYKDASGNILPGMEKKVDDLKKGLVPAKEGLTPKVLEQMFFISHASEIVKKEPVQKGGGGLLSNLKNVATAARATRSMTKAAAATTSDLNKIVDANDKLAATLATTDEAKPAATEEKPATTEAKPAADEEKPTTTEASTATAEPAEPKDPNQPQDPNKPPGLGAGNPLTDLGFQLGSVTVGRIQQIGVDALKTLAKTFFPQAAVAAKLMEKQLETANAASNLAAGAAQPADPNADPNAPAVPAMPTMPAVPAMPAMPTMPAVPAMPTPPMPAMPAIPGVQMPAMPAIPGVKMPAMPAMPAPQQAGGAKIKKPKHQKEESLSTEAHIMGATVIALIAGGSLKGLVDYLMPE